ncbi:MAG: hypothetical protein K5917_07775, partial [Clostridiales bacterium]|nr:hypothetical protein [Clostridiales bacterium]
AIDGMLQPIVENSIPFCVVFGNHDEQALSKEEQMKIYMSYPNCYAIDEGDAISGVGTYNVPIYSRDGQKIVFNLYLFDSGSDDKENGGYDHVKQDQLDWYVKKSNELKAENQNHLVPSMVFQHIPIQEMYYTLSASKTGKGIRGIAELKNYKFTLNSDSFSANNISANKYQEPICCSTVNSGEFNTISEQGDVFAMYFGHDHTNTFVSTFNDIDLGYCPGSGFYSYGDDYERAVRIFEISSSSPSSYTTRLVTYKSYFGTKVDNKFHFLLTKYQPKNLTDGILLGVKGLALLVAIVVAILLIVKRPFSKWWKKKVEYAKENNLPKPTFKEEIGFFFWKIKKAIIKFFKKLTNPVKVIKENQKQARKAEIEKNSRYKGKGKGKNKKKKK